MEDGRIDRSSIRIDLSRCRIQPEETAYYRLIVVGRGFIDRIESPINQCSMGSHQPARPHCELPNYIVAGNIIDNTDKEEEQQQRRSQEGLFRRTVAVLAQFSRSKSDAKG